MTEPDRDDPRSPDGRAIFGFEGPEAAGTTARTYGEGETAIALAEARGRYVIAEVLRRAGGRRAGVIGDSA